MRLKVNSPDSALASATGANETARESFLTSGYNASRPWAATHFYDRDSHSVEPIRELRKGWA